MARIKNLEQEIQRQMKIYKISYDEAKQLVEDDIKVDKGEPLEWDLTPEQKKVQKQALKTGTRQVKEKVKRERKENPTKKNIICEIAELLNKGDVYSNVEITNSERQIAFTVGESKFELTLVQKRDKK